MKNDDTQTSETIDRTETVSRKDLKADSAHTRHEDPAEDARTSNHTASGRARRIVFRFVLAPIFAVAAVASLVMGILFATILAPKPILQATASGLSSSYLYTEDGVAALSGSGLTMKVSGKTGSQVCLAVGTARDIKLWLGKEKVTVLTGLSSSAALSRKIVGSETDPILSSDQSSDDDEAGLTSFKNSDLWQSVTCGNGAVQVKLADASGKALVAYSSDPLQSVSLSWRNQKQENYTWVWYLAAALLAVFSILCATLLATFKPRKRVKTSAARNLAVEEAQAQDDMSTQIMEPVEENFHYQRPDVVPTHHAPITKKKWSPFGLSKGQVLSAEEALSSHDQDEPDSQEASGSPAIVDPSHSNMVARVSSSRQHTSGHIPGEHRENSSEDSPVGKHRASADDIRRRARAKKSAHRQRKQSSPHLSHLVSQTESSSDSSADQSVPETATTASFSEMAAWLERVKKEDSKPPADNTVDILADEKEKKSKENLFENSESTRITDIQEAVSESEHKADKDSEQPSAEAKEEHHD